jgi:hypothetical protein
LQDKLIDYGIESDRLREIRDKLTDSDLTEQELLQLKQDIAFSMINTIQVTGMKKMGMEAKSALQNY